MLELMQGGSGAFGVTKRQAKRAARAFSGPQRLYVIPYNAPWYELMLSGKLTILAADNRKYGVKTGGVPRRHHGWVGFYTSSRIAREVVERHGLPSQPLRVLLGVGYLEKSRELTPAERYWLTLRFNNMSSDDFVSLCKKFGVKDPNLLPMEDRNEWLAASFGSGKPGSVVALPMPVGHFYRPDSLKRFSRPVPVSYPAGPVMGANLRITPVIRRALREVGVDL